MSIEEVFHHLPPFPAFRLWGSSSVNYPQEPNPSLSPDHTPPVTVEFHRHEVHRWISHSSGDGNGNGNIFRWTHNPLDTHIQVRSFPPSLFLVHNAAHRALSRMLTALELDLDQASHDTVIDSVIEFAQPASTSRLVADIMVVTDHVRDETEMITQATAEAVAAEVLRTAEEEQAVQELLATAEAAVKREDEGCVICMEELPRGSVATRMPCGHWFHGDCIGRWLKCSRYCPLCRCHIL